MLCVLVALKEKVDDIQTSACLFVLYLCFIYLSSLKVCSHRHVDLKICIKFSPHDCSVGFTNNKSVLW
jgi:hypothetical protein